MKKLLGTLIAVGAMALMAVGVQAATYSAGVASPEAGMAEVPVLVTPDEGQTESVNGYVMTLTYDSTKVTPVVAGQDVTGADCYAVAGEKFADGVLVSDVVKTEGNNVTLAVAWAAADAVTVDAQTELANVDFEVADTAAGEVPITVAVAALTNDGNSEAIDYDAVDGEITIDAEKILYGDADLDTYITSNDADLTVQWATNGTGYTELQKKIVDVDGDVAITSNDVDLIIQKAINGEDFIFPVEK